MIKTKSKFYYGHTIDIDNNLLDFKEGAGAELTATLSVGEYSLTNFVTELIRALNDAGSLTYSGSLNRTTKRFLTTQFREFKKSAHFWASSFCGARQ